MHRPAAHCSGPVLRLSLASHWLQVLITIAVRHRNMLHRHGVPVTLSSFEELHTNCGINTDAKVLEIS